MIELLLTGIVASLLLYTAVIAVIDPTGVGLPSIGF